MNSEFRFGTVGSPIGTPKKPGGQCGRDRVQPVHRAGCARTWLGAVGARDRGNLRGDQIDGGGTGSGVERPRAVLHQPERGQRGMAKVAQALDGRGALWQPGGGNGYHLSSRFYFANDPVEVLKVAIPRLQGCVDELRRKGNPVTLRPETMGKSAMLGSFEDALEMSGIAGVQPCLDFAHLHARPGDGTMNTYDEWSRLLESIRRRSGREGTGETAHPSFGDRVWTEGRKNHLPLAEADLKLKACSRR